MKLGIFEVSMLGLLGACTTGAVGDDVNPPGDDMPGDRITCMSELTFSGSFTVGDPQPAEIAGCWPVGTWTWTTSVANNSCTSPPPLEASYSFRGERDLASPDPDYTYNYTMITPNDPGAEIAVQSGGGGICTAGIKIYSTDGLSVANMHPALQTGGILNGIGTFEVHTMDQRPPTDP